MALIRRRWLAVAAVVAVLGCATTGVVLTMTVNDGCPPLVECLSPHGEFFVRNERSEPITIQFERPRGPYSITVEARSTDSFDGCEPTRITAVPAGGGAQIASTAGGICVNKTWTFAADGSVQLTDGLPPD